MLTNVNRFLLAKLDMNYHSRKSESDVLCSVETKQNTDNHLLETTSLKYIEETEPRERLGVMMAIKNY